MDRKVSVCGWMEEPREKGEGQELRSLLASYLTSLGQVVYKGLGTADVAVADPHL